MRRAILRAATFGFDPDLIIVDQRPAGAEGELLGTLAALRKRRRRPRVVLGLKDIPMSPTRARRSPLPFQTIEHYYDEVWVYGAPAVFDTVREHAFPAAVARKTTFCGYFDALPADDPPPAAPGSGQAPETRVDGAGPHVLVLPGWGVDGSRLIEAYLRGLLQLPRRCALRTTVVLGAMMPADRRRALLERFGRLPDVSFWHGSVATAPLLGIQPEQRMVSAERSREPSSDSSSRPARRYTHHGREDDPSDGHVHQLDRGRRRPRRDPRRGDDRRHPAGRDRGRDGARRGRHRHRVARPPAGHVRRSGATARVACARRRRPGRSSTGWCRSTCPCPCAPAS